ncbi:CpaF family protein [Paenibacillus ginsengarvi]|uniref:CpaF family protein n=1 Tax=Paenibacillus ginsengarvi TaxID=400777 RepID=A0A3B0CG05_9BACL|nr:CpaF family protein [Paenibacillus ginsengarvi]RKN84150.1 CpaF family protein [Paenibacillus ginsengarvi]
MSIDSITRTLRETVRNKIDLSGAHSDESFTRLIEETVLAYSGERYLSARDRLSVVKTIFNSFRGLDVLQPLIDSGDITEIMINAHDEIFIERNGRIERHTAQFESAEKLEDVIQTIVAKVNRVVNESSPIVDARLADGSRVNVVLPPIALKGPAMTIRKFPASPLLMGDLIARGAIDGPAADFLATLVRAKYNLFIGGGTGSGKTTFLNALCAFVQPDERIITIEDSAELQIQGVPNWVRLETRNANTEGKGAITIRELIRSSLRMRPNRIIVGEVRGAECFDMLQAMNTGHDGSLSTGHANSVADMLSRLETMVLSGGGALPVEVVRKQIDSALDVMIHLTRFRDRSRKVTEITELAGFENGEYRLNPLYTFVETGEDEAGNVIGGLVPTGNRLQNVQKLKLSGIES